MRDFYIKVSQGFIIVYSVTQYATFKEAKEMHERIINVKKNSGLESTTPIIIVANKCDVPEAQREVPHNQGEAFAKPIGKFFETSAKTRVNVDSMFMEIAAQTKYSVMKQLKESDSKEKEKRTSRCILF